MCCLVSCTHAPDPFHLKLAPVCSASVQSSLCLVVLCRNFPRDFRNAVWCICVRQQEGLVAMGIIEKLVFLFISAMVMLKASNWRLHLSVPLLPSHMAFSGCCLFLWFRMVISCRVCTVPIALGSPSLGFFRHYYKINQQH